ncbi:hypothetical protein AB0B56_14200 [Streptosporangium canum]|uniref:hypothetical protein n=1 Tax=Streptosporangium canum TaxID=324952 RepID=UPI00341DFBBF
MGQITRSRRAQIQREATAVRMRGQREGFPLARIVTALCTTCPELSPLEAWRLALGWSRAQTIAQVADLYLCDGLKPPALSEAMLCRFEHGPDRPGPEYAGMLARAYGAGLDQLGLRPRCVCGADLGGYGQQTAPLIVPGVEMTAAGLPAVRESLRLALLNSPYGSPAVVELAEAAVEHYALNYSRHVPAHLFDEVHAARSLLGDVLAAPVNATIGAELRRSAGWLSALLGNLAFHLADPSGARAHLAVAASFGEHVGDAQLVAWAYGAQSMLARARGDLSAALRHAEASAAHAVGKLGRAQAAGWALLPTLARLSRAADAERALAEVGAQPGDAAARALDVLERVPADRLRSTARTRLGALTAALGGAGPA